MNTTVVLTASPRRQSNTDILAGKLVEGLVSAGSADDRIDKIDLVERQEMCCGCGQCRRVGACLQFPEVNALLEKIKQADGIVLATPTWWMGPSSYLKVFMDHWAAFLRPDKSSRIAGKRAAIISCCGNGNINLAEKVCKDLAMVLTFLQVRVVGSVAIKDVVDYGAVLRDEDALQKAFELGRNLYAG